MSMLNRPNLIREGAVLALLLLVAQMPTASAQVQRSFLNLSFEEPPIPGSNCFSIRVSWEFPEYAGGTPTVPGWRTTETHPGSWASNTTGSCGGHPPEPPARGGLQIFKAPFQSTEAADGVQFAELNAFTPSRLFQTVCLMEGDVVDWYLHHKARSNLTGGEEFEFNISTDPEGGSGPNDTSKVIPIVTARTGGSGNMSMTCGPLGQCFFEPAANGWTRYYGTFEWTGATGEQTIGFQAFEGGAGGNFLDAISVFGISPVVEFDLVEAEGFEGDHTAANFPIKVRVSGNIPAGETLAVEVAIVPVTADGSDVSPSDKVMIEIPAGDYAGEAFPIPLNVLADDLREDKEQFRLELVDKPGAGGYRIGSVTACGEPGKGVATYTILDAHMTFEKTGTFVDVVGGLAPDGTPIKNAGDRMDYVFTLVNTGSVDLADIVVSDTIIGTPTLDPSQSDVGADGRLPAGGKAVFIASYTLTQADIDRGEISNTANVTASLPDYPDRPPLTATSSHTELIPHIPSINVSKTGAFDPETDDGDGLPDPGERLRFDISVINDGNVTALGVQVSDPGPTFDGKPGTGTMTPFPPQSADILPGETVVFTAYYTLTSEDIEAASGISDGVANQASATATSPTGEKMDAEMPGPTKLTMPGFAVEKTAAMPQAQRGSVVPYTITVKPLGLIKPTSVRVADVFPKGFVYVPNSATVDGSPSEPNIQGRRLEWQLEVEPEKNVEIGMILGVSASAGYGTYTNIAQAERLDNDVVYRQKGIADVEIIPDPLFDCGDITGKVFNDTNRNGYHDQGETGIAGARVVSVDGLQVTSDEHGRFHITCADLPRTRAGTNYILKLDPRSLPTGYRIISENPRVVRLTPGKMTEVNFATSISRVVRLDIGHEAFIPGSSPRLGSIVNMLEVEPSILRIVYRDNEGNQSLANQRLRELRSLLASHWKEKSNRYRLEIEAKVEVGPPSLAAQ